MLGAIWPTRRNEIKDMMKKPEAPQDVGAATLRFLWRHGYLLGLPGIWLRELWRKGPLSSVLTNRH